MRPMKPENKTIAKQFAKVQKQEQKLLAKKESPLGKKVSAVGKKVEQKLPEPALDAMRAAFEKGFAFVFQNGTGVIEKAGAAQKKRDSYELNAFALQRDPSRKNFKRFDCAAGRAALGNQALSAAEGALLGVLGIGLPDVPVFIGVILKTVYEAAVSYGFSYEDEAERTFVLAVICAGVSKGDEKQQWSARVDRIGYAIDTGKVFPQKPDDLLREASALLADRMLAAKSVQGLPVVGVVGGVTNSVMIGQVGRMAGLKYKKRFLNRQNGIK
ncbi:EcsC family protein [Anaerotruncus rubiinfantis]|uniref:EcsC family protein n=1 Tax=Anaerotruncus rubiinfantis TaxID=1720200 RepID=UPI0034A1B9D4